MTFLQLCQLLREETGIPGTGPSTVVGQTGQSARIVNWVKKANKFIDLMHPDWNYLWSEKDLVLTPAQSIYTLNDMALVGLVRRWVHKEFIFNPTTDSWRPLRWTPWDEAKVTWRLGTKLAQEPDRWTERPDKALEFDNSPLVADTIRCPYFKVPVELAADTDVPAMPAEFHRIIIAKAKQMYGIYEAAQEMIVEGEAEFDELQRGLESQELQDQEHLGMVSSDNPIIVHAE